MRQPRLQKVVAKEFIIKDLDVSMIVEETTRKEILSYLDEYLDNLQYEWFNGQDDCFHILYNDGTEDYINQEYDGHKIKRIDICSIVYDNACTSMVFGNYEINYYGVVTTAIETKINENIVLKVG